MGVEDDAEQGATARLAVGAVQIAAVRELGVVGENGANAREDGVGDVAEDVDLVARCWAGDPEGLIGKS